MRSSLWDQSATSRSLTLAVLECHSIFSKLGLYLYHNCTKCRSRCTQRGREILKDCGVLRQWLRWLKYNGRGLRGSLQSYAPLLPPVVLFGRMGFAVDILQWALIKGSVTPVDDMLVGDLTTQDWLTRLVRSVNRVHREMFYLENIEHRCTCLHCGRTWWNWWAEFACKEGNGLPGEHRAVLMSALWPHLVKLVSWVCLWRGSWLSGEYRAVLMPALRPPHFRNLDDLEAGTA